MKGDVYDDGTPNPLVVKCPICGCTDIGTMIGSGQVEYHCHGCKHAWFARGDEVSTTGPLQYSRPSATAPSYSITTPCNGGTGRVAESPKYGWVCPKCGKVYAPDVKECWNCNYGLANTKVSGQINQSSSAETHMENVTATMGTQEKRVQSMQAGGTNWRKALECEHCEEELE